MREVYEYLKRNNGKFKVEIASEKYTPPVLLEHSRLCSLSNITKEELKEIFEAMVSLAEEKGGVGLAANQIGIAKSFFVFYNEDHWEMAINPEFHKKSVWETSAEISVEGCLSMPGVVGHTIRYNNIILYYYDQNIQHRKVENAAAMTEIIFQHEMDHLNGKLLQPTPKFSLKI